MVLVQCASADRLSGSCSRGHAHRHTCDTAGKDRVRNRPAPGRVALVGNRHVAAFAPHRNEPMAVIGARLRLGQEHVPTSFRDDAALRLELSVSEGVACSPLKPLDAQGVPPPRTTALSPPPSHSPSNAPRTRRHANHDAVVTLAVVKACPHTRDQPAAPYWQPAPRRW